MSPIPAITIRRHVRVLALVAGGVFAIASLCGQTAADHALLDGKNAVRREAFAAFKAGDAATAVSKLRLNLIRELHARHDDLQLASEIAGMACWLRNDGDRARAKTAAALAISTLGRPQDRMPAKDAAAAWALVGDMYDLVLADRPKAVAAYQQALVIDPSLQHAAAQVDRVKAIQERARARDASNEMLRLRAAGKK